MVLVIRFLRLHSWLHSWNSPMPQAAPAELQVLPPERRTPPLPGVVPVPWCHGAVVNMSTCQNMLRGEERTGDISSS